MFNNCLPSYLPSLNIEPSTLLESVEDGNPKLFYFPIAGRGELVKLIAVLGGLNLELEILPFDLKPESEYRRRATELGFEGFGFPILQHGNLSINQSSAIQDYLISISPNYPRLNASQKAVDDMFSSTLEDAITTSSKVLFKVEEPNTLTKMLDKQLGLLNNYVPDSGFIHGGQTPTKADLVIFIIIEASIPFGSTIDMVGGYDFAIKFPKLKQISDAVGNYPVIAEFLKTEDCKLKSTI